MKNLPNSLMECLQQKRYGLQTVYKREKSREESSKVSGSGFVDVFLN